MLDLLFNPNGKIGYRALLLGGAVVIIIGLLKNLSPLVFGENPIIVLLGYLIAFVLIYCWVVLWMKRYRGAGKDPVWCLLPIFVFGIVYCIAMMFVFGDMFGDMVNIAMENPEDEAALEAGVTEYVENNMDSLTIRAAVFTAITSAAVLFIFNLLAGKEIDLSDDFA